MDNFRIQFIGAPKICDEDHNTFYKGFKYFKHNKPNVLAVGDFFFLSLSDVDDPCIGEMQLVWHNSDQFLCHLTLYFLPEQTPDGRLTHHGEHEVVAMADKMTLPLEELVPRIMENVAWNAGLLVQGGSKKKPSITPSSDYKDETVRAFQDANPHLDLEDIYEEKKALGSSGNKQVGVVVLSYPRYCRYRGLLQRLDGAPKEWLCHPLVIALGGILPPRPTTRILFCRETFEHKEVLQIELSGDYIVPLTKLKCKKKRSRLIGHDEEVAEITFRVEDAKPSDLTEEQLFLQGLFKFMKSRNTPIHRVPFLGFKKIDLYTFYSLGQKLGGYKKITSKRLWKKLYDQMGGHPGSTSAATCTRRHYEKLLRPYEYFVKGMNLSPTSSPSPASTPTKKYDETASNGTNEEDMEFDEMEDFDDSKSGYSIDKVKPEPSPPLMTVPPAYSPISFNHNGHYPISGHLKLEENFVDKERRWNEIRKKNALQRSFARQMRPVKSSRQFTTSPNLISKLGVPQIAHVPPDKYCNYPPQPPPSPRLVPASYHPHPYDSRSYKDSYKTPLARPTVIQHTPSPPYSRPSPHHLLKIPEVPFMDHQHMKHGGPISMTTSLSKPKLHHNSSMVHEKIYPKAASAAPVGYHHHHTSNGGSKMPSADEVLDLSVKKHHPTETKLVNNKEAEECLLDLSKKPTTTSPSLNGIENITPPPEELKHLRPLISSSQHHMYPSYGTHCFTPIQSRLYPSTASLLPPPLHCQGFKDLYLSIQPDGYYPHPNSLFYSKHAK